MQSPRFSIREKELRPLFTKYNLEKVWTDVVRQSLKKQFIYDPLDHLDFHYKRSEHFKRIQQTIRSGQYSPGTSRRILVEKSNRHFPDGPQEKAD